MPRPPKKITRENFDLRSFLVGKIRNSFKETPMYAAAKEAAKVVIDVPTKTGKMVPRIHFRCARCGRLFREKGVDIFIDSSGVIEKRRFRGEIAVDHINPVVPVTGWDDWNGFIARHFFGSLQVLCNYTGKTNVKKYGGKSCHTLKTAEENRLRRQLQRKGDERDL